jgi:hypothetical protein
MVNRLIFGTFAGNAILIASIVVIFYYYSLHDSTIEKYYIYIWAPIAIGILLYTFNLKVYKRLYPISKIATAINAIKVSPKVEKLFTVFEESQILSDENNNPLTVNNMSQKSNKSDERLFELVDRT